MKFNRENLLPANNCKSCPWKLSLTLMEQLELVL